MPAQPTSHRSWPAGSSSQRIWSLLRCRRCASGPTGMSRATTPRLAGVAPRLWTAFPPTVAPKWCPLSLPRPSTRCSTRYRKLFCTFFATTWIRLCSPRPTQSWPSQRSRWCRRCCQGYCPTSLTHCPSACPLWQRSLPARLLPLGCSSAPSLPRRRSARVMVLPGSPGHWRCSSRLIRTSCSGRGPSCSFRIPTSLGGLAIPQQQRRTTMARIATPLWPAAMRTLKTWQRMRTTAPIRKMMKKMTMMSAALGLAAWRAAGRWAPPRHVSLLPAA
mmetsp:Transcript_16634/g.46414  ORF Transcript_16634/g.46414 Transcript_16634/m.46414 type:complete len:275 (-) Transcript_16634:371-1195(-)